MALDTLQTVDRQISHETMDLDSARKLLNIYIENSRRILAAHFGVDRAERCFFDVIELIREHPQLRCDFLEAVRVSFLERDPRSLDEGALPRELIELATHELRWPEFDQIAEQRIDRRFGGDRSYARSDPAMAIAPAYHPEWEDREFYRRYNKPERDSS